MEEKKISLIRKYFNMPNPILDYNWNKKNIYIQRMFITMVEKVYRNKDVLTQKFTINPFFIVGNKLKKINGVNYKNLKITCEDLMRIVINHYPIKSNKFKLTHLVSYADYEEGKLTVQFSPFVVYLLENIVDVTYTKQHFQSLITMKSMYAMNMYNFFSRRINIKSNKKLKLTMQIDEFREKAGLPENKFSKWINLRQGVIERIQIYFLKYTNLRYNYIPKKLGKKITGIEFVIFYNKEFTPLYQKKELPKEQHLLLLKKYIPTKDVYEIAVKLHGNNPRYIRYITNKYNDDKSNGRIKESGPAYFFALLKNNHEQYLAKHKIEETRKKTQEKYLESVRSYE